MNALLALDIDGTLVPGSHPLSEEMAAFLTKLHNKGNVVFIITGRTFGRAYKTLQNLHIPYYLAVQNGALIFEMPSKKILFKRVLEQSILPEVEAICEKEKTGVVVYGGYEQQDHCYFRPACFSETMKSYLEERYFKSGEQWIAVDSFDTLPFSTFPSIKCFAHLKSAQKIALAFETKLNLHVPLCIDPFYREIMIAQATESQVSKGQAITDLLSLRTGKKEIVIAAGDDLNDIPMFKVAHIAIAMETSPEALFQYADIIAPAAKRGGLIQALSHALNTPTL